MARERFLRGQQADAVDWARRSGFTKKGRRKSHSGEQERRRSTGSIPAGADLWKMEQRAARKAARLANEATEATPEAGESAESASLPESSADLLGVESPTRGKTEVMVQAVLRAASAARSIAHREAFAGLARTNHMARRDSARHVILERRSEDAMRRFLGRYGSIRSRSAPLPEVDRRDRDEVSVLMGQGLTRPEAVTISRMRFLRTPFLQGLKDADGTVIATPEQTRRFMLIEYQTLSEEVARYTQSDEFKKAIKGKDFEFAKALILAKAEPEGEAPEEGAGESDEVASTADSGSDE